MKRLDTYLQRYRQRAISRYLPNRGRALFDIGCQDGALMHSLSDRFLFVYGCDPELDEIMTTGNHVRIPEGFPDALRRVPSSLSFDVFTALAVFEHMTAKDISESGGAIASRLEHGGVLVATVPSPLVDHILHLLISLRLIDGQEAHQHHGFVPKDLVKLFEGNLRLVKHRRFQLGLNNLFVFQGIADSRNTDS